MKFRRQQHKVEKMTMAEVFEGSLGSWAMGDVFGFNSSGLRLCTMSVSSDDKVFILGDELWGILTRAGLGVDLRF